MTNHIGTQKITFGRPGGPDSEYQSKKRAAEQQARYLDLGVDLTEAEGVGQTFMKAYQDPEYGNINSTTGDMIEGINSNFTLEDSPANAPLLNPKMSTGSVDFETSSTINPQTDPQDLDTSALEEKMDLYRKGAARTGLNPTSIYRLGQ